MLILKTTNQLQGIQWNLTGSKISTSSTKFVFFMPIGKTRWQPWPLIGWDIFDFFSETAKRNSTKLDRKQDLNVLFVFVVMISKQKWPPWPIPPRGGTLYSGARYVALWASWFMGNESEHGTNESDEPRKKDTHSLYLQIFQQGPFQKFSGKRYKFKITSAICT